VISDWLIPLLLFVFVLFLAIGPTTKWRFVAAGLAVVIAVAAMWLLGGHPPLMSPYVETRLGPIVLAGVIGIIVVRFIWSIRTGEPMFE